MLNGLIRKNFRKITLAFLAILTIGSLSFVPSQSVWAARLAKATPMPTNIAIGDSGSMNIDVADDPIMTVAYSGDGHYLAAGFKNGISFYDASTQKFLKTVDLSFSENEAEQLVFSPDNKMLAAITRHKDSSESATSSVYVWDLTDWSMLFSIKEGRGAVTGLAWNSKSTLLTISRDKTDDNGNAVFVYSLDGALQESHESPQVSSLAIHTEKDRLFYGNPDGFLYIYDTSASHYQGRVKFHPANIGSLAINPAQNLLAAGDEDGNLMMLDTSNGNAFLLKEKAVSFKSGVSLSPDGSLTAYCTSKGNLALSQVNVIEPMQTLYSGTDKESCNATAFSPDGSILAGGFTDGNMRLYRVDRTSLKTPDHTAPFAHEVLPSSTPTVKSGISLNEIPVQTIPTLSKGAIVDSNSSEIKVLEKKIELEDFISLYQDQLQYPVEFSGTSNSTLLAKDRTAKNRAEIVDGTIINVMDGNRQIHVSLAANGLNLTTITFSSKDDLIAGGTTDGTVFIWNYLTGEKKCEIFTTPNKVRALKFNHGGSLLAAGYGNMKLDLFSVESCTRAGTLPDTVKPVNQLTFSPDDQYLVTAETDTSAQVFKISTQESLFKFVPDFSRNGLYSAVYNPDQTLVAVGSYEGILTIWNVNSRELLLRLSVGSDDNPITNLFFSKDGTKLFACLKDKTCSILGVPAK